MVTENPLAELLRNEENKVFGTIVFPIVFCGCTVSSVTKLKLFATMLSLYSSNNNKLYKKAILFNYSSNYTSGLVPKGKRKNNIVNIFL